MAVQARFFVDQITKRASFEGIEVTLKASTKGEGNKSWAQWTPMGDIKMTVNDPGGAQWFEDHFKKDVALIFDDAE